MTYKTPGKRGMTGKNKKGTVYHQQFDRSRRKTEDSHKNGWLSGLKKSLKRGTLSQADYEDAVERFKMFANNPRGDSTYRVAQWWSRKG